MIPWHFKTNHHRAKSILSTCIFLQQAQNSFAMDILKFTKCTRGRTRSDECFIISTWFFPELVCKKLFYIQLAKIKKKHQTSFYLPAFYFNKHRNIFILITQFFRILKYLFDILLHFRSNWLGSSLQVRRKSQKFTLCSNKSFISNQKLEPTPGPPMELVPCTQLVSFRYIKLILFLLWSNFTPNLLYCWKHFFSKLVLTNEIGRLILQYSSLWVIIKVYSDYTSCFIL